MLQRRSNTEGIFYWKAETDTHPEFGDVDYGTAPATPTIGQFIDTPQITENGGRTKGRGAGTHLATHTILDSFGRDITIPTRVTSGAAGIALLSACLPNATTGALTSLAIWTGVSNRNTNAARQYVDRWCKCASGSIRVARGSEMTFTPTFYGMGRPEIITTSLLAPTYSDIIGAAGEPEQFTTLTDVPLNGVNVRPYLTAIEFTFDNDAANMRRGVENNLGADVPTDRRTLQLVNGPLTISGTISLDADVAASVIAGAGAAATWEYVGAMAVQIGDINLTFAGVELNGNSSSGGPAMGQMGWSIPFIATSLVPTNDA